LAVPRPRFGGDWYGDRGFAAVENRSDCAAWVRIRCLDEEDYFYAIGPVLIQPHTVQAFALIRSVSPPPGEVSTAAEVSVTVCSGSDIIGWRDSVTRLWMLDCKVTLEDYREWIRLLREAVIADHLPLDRVRLLRRFAEFQNEFGGSP